MVGPARAVAAKWVCEMADLVATATGSYPVDDQQQKSKKTKEKESTKNNTLTMEKSLKNNKTQ